MDSFYGQQQQSHECNYCSKILPSHAELVEHKKTHTGDRPFSCHICGKRFTQKAHLNIHKRTHTGEKPYACHVCHKRFAQSSHLNSHKRIHTGDRPFFCVVCNTGFSQKHRFDAHLPCMQKSQSSRGTSSASTALGGGRGSYSVSDQLNLASSAAAAAAFASVGNSDASSIPEQKPDIALINSLNQTLMQQLADLSSSSESFNQGVSLPVGSDTSGLNDSGADDTSGFGSKSEGVTEYSSQVIKEENRSQGNIPSAYMAASSTHRRKPAFIRRVDNESGEDNSVLQNMETEQSSLMSNSNSFQEADYDGDSTDFDENEVPFDNGARNSAQAEERNSSRRQVPGPLPANPSVLPMRISTGEVNVNGNVMPGERGESSNGQVRTNHRISLVNFTAEELIAHLMSRGDVHRCDYCRLIFQDAAMYHIHRNMHDKNDLRCCNFCGKMLQDKYDFTAHFLNEHR